jgi:hypothetical protein
MFTPTNGNGEGMDCLSIRDGRALEELQTSFTNGYYRYRRNRRDSAFQSMLQTIKSFCVQNNSSDCTRMFVCGICWIEPYIGVNVQRLSQLTGKCKSNINGCLKHLGYKNVETIDPNCPKLHEVLPCQKDNFHELRQWTIRIFKVPPRETKDNLHYVPLSRDPSYSSSNDELDTRDIQFEQFEEFPNYAMP